MNKKLQERQEPQNLSEYRAYQRLLDDGYEVVTRGWPDMMAVKKSPSGEVVEVRVIEVKHATDSIRPSQEVVLNALAGAGIRVEVWRHVDGEWSVKVLGDPGPLPPVKTLERIVGKSAIATNEDVVAAAEVARVTPDQARVILEDLVRSRASPVYRVNGVYRSM